MFRAIVLSFFIILLSFIPAQAADQKTSISAEAFGRLPDFKQIKLSPNGLRMASIQNLKGTLLLVTQSFDEKDKRKLYAIDFGEFEVNFFRWVSDTRLVISLGFDEVERYTRFRVSRMIAVNWDKSNLTQLIKRNNASQFHDNIISMLPDDPDHIYFSWSGSE